MASAATRAAVIAGREDVTPTKIVMHSFNLCQSAIDIGMIVTLGAATIRQMITAERGPRVIGTTTAERRDRAVDLGRLAPPRRAGEPVIGLYASSSLGRFASPVGH